MGVCCISKQRQQLDQSQLTIINSADFPDLRLQFTTRPSSRECQCLIIFTNITFDIADCAFLAKISQHDKAKLKEQIKMEAQKRPVKLGEFIVIDKPEKLNVGKLMVVVLPVWKRPEVNNDIFAAVKLAYDEVARWNIKNLLICEPSQELGVPNNVAAKIIMNVIHDAQAPTIQSITFFLYNKRDQNYYHQVASKWKSLKQLSSLRSDY